MGHNTELGDDQTARELMETVLELLPQDCDDRLELAFFAYFYSRAGLCLARTAFLLGRSRDYCQRVRKRLRGILKPLQEYYDGQS